ncbi:MAG: hypothetical protein AB8B79_08880 [Granulosicoccus sp.]
MSKSLDYPELIALEALMQLMLQAAEGNEWEEVSRIDVLRRSLLEQDNASEASSSVSPGKTPDTFNKDENYMQLAEKIIRLDELIMATVVRARDSVASENKVLRDQLKAKSIYQQNSLMSNFDLR